MSARISGKIISSAVILNRSSVGDEYLHFLKLKSTLGKRLGTGFIDL